MPASSPATDSLSLLESFEPLEDLRHGEIYPLEEIVVLVICATISGADTFVAVEEFGEARLEWLQTLLPFEDGVPSHDVLSGVFGRIDPVQFEDCFRRWVQSIRGEVDGEVVVIDGKTLCGSGDRATGKEPRHLVEAWATEQRLVLGQRQSENGSNEIEAIPQLLEELLLEECNAWIDAMGCQTDIAEAIQEGLRSDIEQVFERCREQGLEPGTTDVDGGHGRVETRRCWAMKAGGRGLIDSERWTNVNSIALIETERFEADPSAESDSEDSSIGGETTTEKRYVLSSLPPDATRFLEATRRHWRIENGLHWSLDVAFGEDDSQVRSGNAADNLGRVRRLALSTLKQDDSVDGGTETKRLRAGWDTEYLEHLLGQL